jgi:hypothetical protein
VVVIKRVNMHPVFIFFYVSNNRIQNSNRKKTILLGAVSKVGNFQVILKWSHIKMVSRRLLLTKAICFREDYMDSNFCAVLNPMVHFLRCFYFYNSSKIIREIVSLIFNQNVQKLKNIDRFDQIPFLFFIKKS